MMGGGQLNYLLRLRGSSSGIVDLAGNSITNHNVDYTSTPSSLGGGTALKFNGSNAYLDIEPLSKYIEAGEDYTVSIQVLTSIPIINKPINSIYPYFLFFQESGSSQTASLYYQSGTARPPGVFFSNGRYGDYIIDFLYDQMRSLSSYHLTFVRKNNVITMYVNGTACSNPLTNSGQFNDINDTLRIGYNPFTSLPYKYADYTIDDFCIIKGKALWTSNFTPPTSYLPDKI